MPAVIPSYIRNWALTICRCAAFALGVAAAALCPPTASAATLVDLNADGTARNATLADFEAATGLPSGTFSGDSIVFFPNNDPGGGFFTQTVSGITVEVSQITNDADGWFGAGTDNNLLDDGLFHRDGSADPTATITLSGPGLGLLSQAAYDLYLFAGRSQGHETAFTFDPANPSNPSSGTMIAVEPPVVSGDNTLGTARFGFDTLFGAPSSLAIRWDGQQNISGNQDAVFSGFALVQTGQVPEPSTGVLIFVALAGASRLRRRTMPARRLNSSGLTTVKITPF